MPSKDTEDSKSVTGDTIENKEIENEERAAGDEIQLQNEPASNLVVFRNSDDNFAMPALFDSIIAAPLQIKKQKTHTSVYSE